MVRRSIKAEVVRTLGFIDITSSYNDLGTPLQNYLVIMFLKNSTDKTIFISENGVDDHYHLSSGSTSSWDFQSNARDGLILSKPLRTQFSVRCEVGDIPSSGMAILEGQSV